jgi:RNA polymerase sigma-B factor
VLEAMEVGRALRVGSLDAPLDPDDPGSSVQVGVLDSGMELVEDRGVLGPAVARLPQREQLILRLRFVDGLSQAEIGRRIGLSQMQVSRLLASSLDRLRGWLVDRTAAQPS